LFPYPNSSGIGIIIIGDPGDNVRNEADRRPVPLHPAFDEARVISSCVESGLECLATNIIPVAVAFRLSVQMVIMRTIGLVLTHQSVPLSQAPLVLLNDAVNSVNQPRLRAILTSSLVIEDDIGAKLLHELDLSFRTCRRNDPEAIPLGQLDHKSGRMDD
jgi:hypothetical protein